MWDAYAPLLAVRRNGRPESVHHGALVVLDERGDVELAIGDPNVVIFGRSAWKPVQAAALVGAGLALPPEELAVVAGSHSGGPEQLALVRRVLRRAGLTEAALANAPSLPRDVGADAGGRPTPLHSNCSGKHAGMLAACVINGWDTSPRYLQEEHPVQRTIRAAAVEAGGSSVAFAGPDGCGAPALVSSLRGLAAAFREIAIAPAGTPAGEVAAAMRRHPRLTTGPDGLAAVAMEQRPDAIVKDGAQGVLAVASASGRAAAVKVGDGSSQVLGRVLVALLGRPLLEDAQQDVVLHEDVSTWAGRGCV